MPGENSALMYRLAALKNACRQNYGKNAAESNEKNTARKIMNKYQPLKYKTASSNREGVSLVSIFFGNVRAMLFSQNGLSFMNTIQKWIVFLALLLFLRKPLQKRFLHLPLTDGSLQAWCWSPQYHGQSVHTHTKKCLVSQLPWADTLQANKNKNTHKKESREINIGREEKNTMMGWPRERYRIHLKRTHDTSRQLLLAEPQAATTTVR